MPRPLDYGECEDGSDLCLHGEDLYRRVAVLDDLAPAKKWHYRNRRVYPIDDPIRLNDELGVTPMAFGGSAKDVMLKRLIIEKYAQEDAIFIDRARDWRVVDVIARWNHRARISFEPETKITRGSFSHNGQSGDENILRQAIVAKSALAVTEQEPVTPARSVLMRPAPHSSGLDKP